MSNCSEKSSGGCVLSTMSLWPGRGAAASSGGWGRAGDTQPPLTIAGDLTRHNLKNRPIKPGELA